MISKPMLCFHCNKKLGKNRNKGSKFCNKKCRDNFQYKNNPKARESIKKHSLKHYHKISKTSEYKKYKRKYQQEWIEKNRKSHNAYMKKYMHNRWKKYAKRRKKK